MAVAMFARVTAKQLKPDARFVPDSMVHEAARDDWSWRVISHEFTARGDYTTLVESDGTTWTERFGPDEPVWLRANDLYPAGGVPDLPSAQPPVETPFTQPRTQRPRPLPQDGWD